MRIGIWQLLVLAVLLGIPCAIIFVVLLCVKTGGGKGRKSDGRICPACGCPNSGNARFCVNCGKQLPEGNGR